MSDDTNGLAVGKCDIILRPGEAVARQTVDIFKIAGDEIRLVDVPVK